MHVLNIAHPDDNNINKHAVPVRQIFTCLLCWLVCQDYSMLFD